MIGQPIPIREEHQIYAEMYRSDPIDCYPDELLELENALIEERSHKRLFRAVAAAEVVWVCFLIALVIVAGCSWGRVCG